MERLRFALTSDQLELLLAFENAEGLSQLTEWMARDPSVVSRNLQRIAESQPVLKKVKGRWEITPLGLQTNQQTRAYIEEQTKLFSNSRAVRKPQTSLCSDQAVLIVINAQNGLLNPTQEGRNNEDAEKNIALLLASWRTKKRQVIHIKHVSENPESIFFRQSPGCDFLEALRPQANEIVLEKTKSSALRKGCPHERNSYALNQEQRPNPAPFTGI